MKIYRLGWPNGYEFLNPAAWDDTQALSAFGKGVEQLPPVEVVLERSYQEAAKDHLLSSDFPWLAGVPAYSRRAVGALRSVLDLHGNVVPLRGAEDAFCALDVRIRLNALDFDQSSVQRFRSSGRIMMIESYAFRPEAIEGWAIFVDRGWDEVFVTQDYVDAVAETDLVGAEFELLAPL